MAAGDKLLGRDIDMNSNKIKNLVDPTTAQEPGTKNYIDVTKKSSIAQINTGSDDNTYPTSLGLNGSKYIDQSGTKIFATAAGTDTYTASLSPAITAYSNVSVFIKFSNANTGASTLNLNSLGAKTIKKNGGAALVSGDISAGTIYALTYDGTDFYLVQGIPGVAGVVGSVWRDGTGVPSNALGVNGDYYLNDANGDVYLKSSGTYSVVANIKGANGSNGVLTIVAAGGTANAITATYTPAITLTDQTLCVFVASGANTITNPTFAPNGLTAHTITKNGGQPLVAGDIPNALAVCILEYNTANSRWELLNPAIPSKVITQSQNDNSTSPASTAYTDLAIANAIAGVNPAVAVKAATTSSADLAGYTYNNGVSGIGATLIGPVNTPLVVDGYTFINLGDRLLEKDNSTGAYRGIYYVTQLSTALLPVILTRALDYNQPSDINNTGAIPVTNGTDITGNKNTSWILTSTITTVGTDTFTYQRFTYSPNDELLKSGNLAGLNSNKISRVNLGLETRTGHGDSDYTILSTDSYLVTSATFTSPRVWTLPAASSFNAGQEIIIEDEFGTLSASLTLTISRAGSDTINGGTTEVMNAQYGQRRLFSDGVSKWSFDAAMVRLNQTQTLTNKTIDANNNTISNLLYTAIKTVIGNANKFIGYDNSGAPALFGNTGVIKCSFDGSNGVIPVGLSAKIAAIPSNGTITSFYLVGTETNGSIQIDLRKWNGSAYVSVIGAGNKPIITSGQRANALANGSWTSKTLVQYDEFLLIVESNTIFTYVDLVINYNVTG